MKELLDGLLDYQREWLFDRSRFKLGLWARQTGKDYTCAAEAVFDCVTFPKRHWLILACGERQARESLEKAKEWAERVQKYELGIRNSGEGKRTPHVVPYNGSLMKRVSATEIRFANGSRITALPARKETIRGYSANLILTEFAFHDDPEGIWRAIFPSVSNPLRGGAKKVRIISTPNGQGNYFHELWTSSKIFARHRITIHDAVAQGLPMDVAALKEGLLDTEAWAQEYECEFADQSSVLLPYELVEQCEAAEATETSALDQLSRSWNANVRHAPELYVGIDFGRKQDLTVCWVLERVRAAEVEGFSSASLAASAVNRSAVGSFGSGLPTSSNTRAVKDCFITREVLVLRRMPTPAQIEVLRGRVRLARRVCVDYTGAGIGLGDALAQEFGGGARLQPSQANPIGKVELCTFTAPLKEEIFVKLRAAFERRSLWIPKSSEIREDLHSMHRVVSQSGNITFRAARTADGHSDRCTALALALRAAESTPRGGCATTVGRKYRSGMGRPGVLFV